MEILPGSCGTGIAWCVVYEILFAACAGAIAIGLLTMAVHVVYRVPRFRRQERTLQNLAQMRAEGIRLRNMRPLRAPLLPPTHDDLNTWLQAWYEAMENWQTDLYAASLRLSPVEEERLRTIDWLSDREHGGLIVTGRQLFVSREASATIERLDIMLQQRFRPRNPP